MYDEALANKIEDFEPDFIILAGWMRLLTIPNQSSVPRAWTEFENGRISSVQVFFDTRLLMQNVG